MNDNKSSDRQFVTFDLSAVSILETIFKCSAESGTEGDLSKTAHVKFMITRQDEKDLRDLGYNQEQIDKLKPEEVETIIQTGLKAGT